MTDAAGLPSHAGSLVRLGLKLSLGSRGEYVTEYLDERAARRSARRLEILGDAATEAGLSAESAQARIDESDAAAELVDEIVSVAQQARYDEKVQYLGRCLAQALAT